jgi:NAD+ synthase (glutamine-hydrolysing)
MKLAIAQINTTVGDLAGNIERILNASHEVSNLKPDLTVFPEMTVPGYPPRDILYDASFVDAVQLATQDLAHQANGLPPMLIGSFVPSGENLYEHPALHNVIYLVHAGKLKVVQIKQLLPMYDVFYEPRWFVPGKGTLPPIEIAGQKVGVLVCEDMWDEQYPVHPGADLKRMGADLLVCMSASPYRRHGMQGRLVHAGRQGLPIAFVNLVGANDELIFDGGSFVLGRESLRIFDEEVRVVTMDGGRRTTGDEAWHMVNRQSSEEEVFKALTLGIGDFARKNNLQNAFIGLSGGIDSSVAAVIAVEALGASHVTGIAIPSRYTDPRSTNSARELARGLGIKLEIVELEKMHVAAEQVLGPERNGGIGGENIQARLRMIILMSYVNQFGGFLINTSNKTELALGYSTLYGDMSGTIGPLGDLTKPEVYALARFINTSREVIPSYVMTRPPSAELKPDQVDPFDYDALSPELEKLVIANQSNAKMRGSEHKRWQMGLVLKVSAKSFGRGRMMPITRK